MSRTSPTIVVVVSAEELFSQISSPFNLTPSQNHTPKSTSTWMSDGEIRSLVREGGREGGDQ